MWTRPSSSLVLCGQDEAREPGVREAARLQTWIEPSLMFTREQSLEDDSMMTLTIVTITSLMLLWLPGITGHAGLVIFITFWWLSILWQRRLSSVAVLMSGVHVISIDVRSCVSVSFFTHHLSLTPGRVLHCDPAWEPGTLGSWWGLLHYQVIYY